ncbi:MAG: ferric reductase-like transmembrane domain-containing protein [Pseudomonadota bacterium]
MAATRASPSVSTSRAILIWVALAIAIGVPVVAAAFSPQLQWRDAIYIASSFAGIAALSLMLIQPLLIAGALPRLTPYLSRRVHRWVGVALIVSVILHVVGLWITSPPDVIDALTFTSPTPFSAWGVVAMWGVLVVGAMVAARPSLGLRPRTWRLIHTGLAALIVTGTIVHTVLIQGAMETVSKTALCVLVGLATVRVLADVWTAAARRRRDTQDSAPPTAAE